MALVQSCSDALPHETLHPDYLRFHFRQRDAFGGLLERVPLRLRRPLPHVRPPQPRPATTALRALQAVPLLHLPAARAPRLPPLQDDDAATRLGCGPTTRVAVIAPNHRRTAWGVRNGRRRPQVPALRADHPRNGCKAVSGVACPQGLEG
jgi:hypothetical protein